MLLAAIIAFGAVLAVVVLNAYGRRGRGAADSAGLIRRWVEAGELRVAAQFLENVSNTDDSAGDGALAALAMLHLRSGRSLHAVGLLSMRMERRVDSRRPTDRDVLNQALGYALAVAGAAAPPLTPALPLGADYRYGVCQGARGAVQAEAILGGDCALGSAESRRQRHARPPRSAGHRAAQGVCAVPRSGRRLSLCTNTCGHTAPTSSPVTLGRIRLSGVELVRAGTVHGGVWCSIAPNAPSRQRAPSRSGYPGS